MGNLAVDPDDFAAIERAETWADLYPPNDQRRVGRGLDEMHLISRLDLITQVQAALGPRSVFGDSQVRYLETRGVMPRPVYRPNAAGRGRVAMYPVWMVALCKLVATLQRFGMPPDTIALVAKQTARKVLADAAQSGAAPEVAEAWWSTALSLATHQVRQAVDAHAQLVADLTGERVLGATLTYDQPQTAAMSFPISVHASPLGGDRVADEVDGNQ
jgi:hypothetical protein